MLIQTKSFYLKAFNMKQARPRMLANLKIKKCRDFLGRDISGPGRLFLGLNLVSFNLVVVPYEISKVNFRVETKILVSMSEEI